MRDANVCPASLGPLTRPTVDGRGQRRPGRVRTLVVIADSGRRSSRHNGHMARREDNLIGDIEREALDDRASLAGALRKCVVLGGKSGSEELRDWATRELKGYGGDYELPEYRRVPAQIQIDGATMTGHVTGQPIARSSLPDFVQEQVREEVELRDGVGAIEALAERAEATGEPAKLSLPMGADIARVMSTNLRGQQILSIYWWVSPVAIRGVLDQIRTALTLLVAELRAHTPIDSALPSAETADKAVQVVVSGRRHTVNVHTAQATGPGSTASVEVPESPAEDGFWTRSRRIGAFLVGVATIVGAAAAVIAITH